MTQTTLTGTQVRQAREAAGLSRREFAERAGFSTQTRIFNIESKDSWKPGDRERVQSVLDDLATNPPKETHGRKKGRTRKESADERLDRLESALRANGKLYRDMVEPDEDKGPTLVNPEVDFDPDLEGLFTPSEEQADDDGCAPDECATEEDVEEPEEDRLEHSDPAQDWDDLDDTKEEVNALPTDVKLLTNSEVAVWNRCRRKWWLAFYRRLIFGQRDYFGAREIGNRVHRALEGWYVPEGQERVDPRDALERAIVDDWTQISRQVHEHGVQGDEEQVLGELATKFNDAVSLERAMIEGYVEWLQETGEDANLKIEQPEAIIHTPIEGEVAGEHVEFVALAKLDVRGTRVTDGTRLFVDHKTVGNFTEPRKVLHMDPQMLHYHLIEWLTMEGGQRCDAALYNMLRKVKRTQSAKPPFFERVEVHHNAYEIENYKKRLIGAARDIQRATRELDEGADPMSVAYPNPTKACSWDCDFFMICPMVDDGSRVEDAITTLYHQGDPLARYAKDQEVGGI